MHGNLSLVFVDFVSSEMGHVPDANSAQRFRCCQFGKDSTAKEVSFFQNFQFMLLG